MKRINSEMQICFNKIGKYICIFLLVLMLALWMVLIHSWQVELAYRYIIHYTYPKMQKQIWTFFVNALSQNTLLNVMSAKKTLLLFRFAFHCCVEDLSQSKKRSKLQENGMYILAKELFWGRSLTHYGSMSTFKHFLDDCLLK